MRKTLLVIDDDPVFRMYTKHAVVPLAVEFLEAGRGMEGGVLAHNRSPDAIIVDGLLPDTDGVSWIRRYRRGGGKAPILYASAFRQPMPVHRQLTRELLVEVVRKPISTTELVATLARLLGIEHVTSMDFRNVARWMAWDADPDAEFSPRAQNDETEQVQGLRAVNSL